MLNSIGRNSDLSGNKMERLVQVDGKGNIKKISGISSAHKRDGHNLLF